MKKLFFAILGTAAIIGTVSAANSEFFAQATDLYAKTPGGTCYRIVNNVNQLSSNFQTSISGTQAAIRSTTNQLHTLWEDNSCGTAVYFQ